MFLGVLTCNYATKTTNYRKLVLIIEKHNLNMVLVVQNYYTKESKSLKLLTLLII